MLLKMFDGNMAQFVRRDNKKGSAIDSQAKRIYGATRGQHDRNCHN